MARETFRQRLHSEPLTKRFKDGAINVATGLAILGITAAVASSIFGICNWVSCIRQ